MTTHDQPTDTVSNGAAPELRETSDWSDGRGLSPDQPVTSDQPAMSDQPVTSDQTVTSYPPVASTPAEPSRPKELEPQSTEPAESSSGRALFADDELAGLTARWDSVQAGFVDDPRECVQRADGLVSDVVKQLTAGFSNARTRLEDQWSRGEEASTEDLRVALKQYREFFQRLLAV